MGCAAQHQLLAHRQLGRRQQADLLGLVVTDTGGPRQRIEVVFEQALFLRCRILHGHRHARLRLCRPHPVPGLLHVARHQLHLCIPEGNAAPVGERHPAGEVEPVVAFVEPGHIICTPGQPAGQVAQLKFALPGARIVQQKHQRRTIAQGLGHIRIDQPPRHPRFDTITHFQDRNAIVIGQDSGGLRLFCAAGGVGSHQQHVPADILFQQFIRGQQVEIKILLDDAQG